MKIRTRSGESGFIALTSMIILMMVLVLLMFSTSASSFYARFDSLDSEYKRISLGLSESCVNVALLKIAQNYNYDITADPSYLVGKGVRIFVGPDICYIHTVEYDNAVIDPLSGVEVKKTATIHTIAQYPIFAGSWSSNKVQAVIQNPAAPMVSSPVSIGEWDEVLNVKP